MDGIKLVLADITDWLKTEKRYRIIIKVLIALAVPILACLLYCLRQGETIGNVYLPASEWNDELFYFKQVEAIVKYGFPKGYFGFNESCALKLSFAAWSPVLVSPWVVWGLIFKWTYLSPIICNIVLLTGAFVIFVILVKPDFRQLGIIVALFLLYTPFVRYMLSGMPEIICISLLLDFYSVSIWYLRKKKTSGLVWMFIISGYLTLMRPYMLLFLLLPVVLLTVEKKKKGAIISLAVMAVVLGAYALIKHYLGAEYFAPLFFTDWITAFFEQGFAYGIWHFCSKLYNMGTSFISHIIQAFDSGLCSGAIFASYLAAGVVLIIAVIEDFHGLKRLKKDPKEEEGKHNIFRDTKGIGECRELDLTELWGQLIIELHLLFSFVGMLFALLLMYKLTEGSKHLLTFIAVAVFVLGLTQTKFFKKPLFLGIVFAFFFSYKALDPYDYQVPFGTEELRETVSEWEYLLDTEIQPEEAEEISWDYDVVWTFSDKVDGESENLKWQYLYGLPAGCGISCCLNDYVEDNLTSLNSRYIATPAYGDVDMRCSRLGYELLGRDDEFAFYRRY